jgi:hypothetical protein
MSDEMATTASERQKAYRIRAAQRKGEHVSPEDMRWIDEYDQRKESRGASRSHKVSYVEELAEATGTGDAAAVAAAQFAPALAREEGRRIDYLIASSNQSVTIALRAVKDSHEMVIEMARQVMDRNKSLEEVHLAMLDSVREGHLARTNAEAELIRRDADAVGDEGGINGMVAQLMPVILQELTKRKLAPDSKK